MGTICSREILDEIKPDAVIIAVGAHPVKPPIKGIDRAMNALEAYHGMDRIGKRVVLAGGGWWDAKWVFTWQGTAMM